MIQTDSWEQFDDVRMTDYAASLISLGAWWEKGPSGEFAARFYWLHSADHFGAERASKRIEREEEVARQQKVARVSNVGGSFPCQWSHFPTMFADVNVSRQNLRECENEKGEDRGKMFSSD